MRCFAADLHIHTALSPCAAEEMSPPAIVQTAVERGLAMIAICDHNAAGNTTATQRAAQRGGRRRPAQPLAVIAGMEIETSEEVHVAGLFPDAVAAEAAAREVQATLPDADDAYAARFGTQRRMDEAGRITEIESKMLAVASRFDLSSAVALIHRHGGLALAAHVNRPSFSVMSQLGFFPTDAGFDGVEVFFPSDPARPGGAPGGGGISPADEFGGYGLPLVASSDAHFLGDIGRCRTLCTMQAPTFAELAAALAGSEGRGVRCA